MFYRIWKIMQSEISHFENFWQQNAVTDQHQQYSREPCNYVFYYCWLVLNYIKFRKLMKISHEYNIRKFSLHNPEMNPPHVLVSGLSSGFFQWRTVHRIHQRSQQLGERIHLLLGQTQRPVQLEEVIVSLSKLNQKLSQSSLYTLAHY